eukprot:TRINITY_DN11378_c0_g2_i1.p2 TRINITY_DN11378_c0_g2~~TRINITY_DN11378_c0_g2_i1.p2  ORF type:complete len:246 (-),score=48.32 TRINITY_DN11378_c0_g2_i1:22-759(-)
MEWLSSTEPEMSEHLTNYWRKAHMPPVLPEPPMLVPPKKPSNRSWRITDLPCLELARQITLFNQKLLNGVLLDEFHKLRVRPNGTLSLNLMELVDFEESLSYWLAWSVVREPTLKRRVAVLTYVLNLGKSFMELENYNSLNSVCVGMNLPAVNRLSKTWKDISVGSKINWKKMMELMSSENDYQEYFTHLQTRNKEVPFIPCIEALLWKVKNMTSSPDMSDEKYGILNNYQISRDRNSLSPIPTS